MRKYQNRQNCAKPDFNWCLFFALYPSIWAQFYIAPKYWMSGHFELWGQDWIRQKPQQSPMRMVRRERENVVRRKSLHEQKIPEVTSLGVRRKRKQTENGMFFCLFFYLTIMKEVKLLLLVLLNWQTYFYLHVKHLEDSYMARKALWWICPACSH